MQHVQTPLRARRKSERARCATALDDQTARCDRLKASREPRRSSRCCSQQVPKRRLQFSLLVAIVAVAMLMVVGECSVEYTGGIKGQGRTNADTSATPTMLMRAVS